MCETYLRTPDAAKFLGVCSATLYKMIKDGKFTTVRIEASRGFGGKPAFEIARSELETVKATREGRKVKKPVVEEPKKVVVDEAKERRVREIQMALKNVQASMKLLSECIGDLVEKLI